MKKLLRKFWYPSENTEKAISFIIKQAELMSSLIVVQNVQSNQLARTGLYNLMFINTNQHEFDGCVLNEVIGKSE